MDYKRIEILMNKFWECTTTPEEENEIRQFFLDCGELPAHLSPYRELFVWQDEESSVGLDDTFDRRVLAEIGKSHRTKPFFRRFIVRVAACALFVLSVGAMFHYKQAKTVQVAEENMTPGQALAELQKALSFVSETMNEGERLMETHIEKTKVATKYIYEFKNSEL